MVRSSVMAISPPVNPMVPRTPLANRITSAPAALFALRTAWRREPTPLSLTFSTVNVLGRDRSSRCSIRRKGQVDRDRRARREQGEKPKVVMGKLQGGVGESRPKFPVLLYRRAVRLDGRRGS